jgi:uncharacterized membrane protein YccC
MIPMIAVIRVRHSEGAFSLWAPLFLIWPLLALLILCLSPLIVLACLIARQNPWRAGTAAVAVICALSGVHVQVESPGAEVLVRIK